MRFKRQNDDDDDDEYDYDNKINRIIMGITSMEIDGYFSIFFFTFIQLRQCCVHEPHSSVWSKQKRIPSIMVMIICYLAGMPPSSRQQKQLRPAIFCALYLFLFDAFFSLRFFFAGLEL